MEQLSPEWFEARRGLITASTAGGLMGISTFTSAPAARRDWVSALHGKPRKFDSPDMARGRALEDVGIQTYEMMSDCLVISDGGRKFEDWLWASPDGLVGDDGMVEVKAPRVVHAEPYPQYLLQMFLQLLAYGRQWVDFIQIVLGEDGGPTTHVMRFTFEQLAASHEAYITKLKALRLEMLEEPEAAPVEGRDDPEWLSAEHEYRHAKAAADAAKAALDIQKERLLELADRSPVKGVDLQVIEATRAGGVDLRKLATEHPDIDIDAYRKAATTYLQIKELKS